MADLTAQEQYMLELVNRARLDPAGEAARYGIDLNQGLPAGTIAADPKQPLASNPNLATAAQGHSQWMLDTDSFSHTGAGGSSAGDRMRAAGYSFTGSWGWGENISWRGTTGTLNLTATVGTQHEGLFRSAGHRENILDADFREVGIGIRTGNYQGYNASMATQNFAHSGSGQFITGVAYFDGNGDKFYSVGEGRGGVRVEMRSIATGAVTTVTSATAGGYAAKLAGGSYEMIFSGGGIVAPMGVVVALATLNIKVDVVAADGIATNVSATLTGAGKNLTLLGIDSVNATGNGQANGIFGNKGANELNGAGGADTLTGGAGNDVFVLKAGEANGDAIADFAGNGAGVGDTIRFEGYGAGASLQFISGNQWRIVGSGFSEIVTIAGTVSAGDYSFVGAAAAPPADPVTGTAGHDSLTGTTLADVLGGGGGHDSVVGGAGNDWLYGGEGNDTLDGGAGNDFMRGGAGDDVYLVDGLGDTVDEQGGAGDIDEVRSALAIDLSNDARFAGIENAVLLGAAAHALAGDLGANRLEGNAAANLLSGRDGADTLLGAAGNDTLDGGGGIDALVGGKGNDLYIVDDSAEIAAILEAAAEGTDTVRSMVDAALAANLENLTLLGSASVGAGNEAANLILGNDAGNDLRGGGGNDTLTGNSGADTLDGGVGSDSMAGGIGDDRYRVDALADRTTELAGQGLDTVQSEIGWVLGANLENLSLLGTGNLKGTGNALDNLLIGNGGDNLLLGLAGADVLQGGDGGDTLDGGAGADRLSGGAGDDVYVIDDLDTDGAGPDQGDEIVESGGTGNGTDTVRTPFSIDLGLQCPDIENAVLTGRAAAAIGTDDDNRLVGNAIGNFLSGLEGEDTLDGAAGADTLVGGDGDDVYRVDNIGDAIVEELAGGNDWVESTVAFALDATLEHLTLIGSGAIAGTGNDTANKIKGNAGANKLFGLDGADTLWGAGGNDTLDGGTGDDSLDGGIGNDLYLVDSAADAVLERAGEGTDTVHSAAAAFVLAAHVENLLLLAAAGDGTGNDLNNSVTGNAGANALDGAAGNDTLSAGAGDDTLNGGLGIDRMIGGLGNDVFHVDTAGEVVIEAAGQGSDTVRSSVSHTLAVNVENLILEAGAANGTGNSGANIIVGNGDDNGLNGAAGNDALDGDGGNDTLDGGTGNDSLSGGDGDDRLRGGSGNDTLTGGAGVDVHGRLSAADGKDTITDFALGAGGDKLDIGAVLIGYDATDSIGDFVQLAVSGGDTTVRIDANGAAGGAAFVDAFVLAGVVVTDVTQLVADGNLLLT
jgi:Ca2+-binding RTX toxin-like protein